MISTPKTYCPLCGRMTTVTEVVAVSRYAEQVTYACRCGCGISDMIVRRGKIISVSPRNPEKQQDFRIIGGIRPDMYKA